MGLGSAAFLLRPQMNLGLIAQVLFRELPNFLVRFNELSLLARTLVQGGARSKQVNFPYPEFMPS
jgi:hypothetical protein